MTNIPTALTEEHASLVAEYEAAMREGLPRVCAAMIELALDRCEERGLEGSLSDVQFSAGYYDADAVHSPTYQATQADALEELEAEAARQSLPDTTNEYLDELRAYAALPPEERRGVHRSASFSIEHAGRVKYVTAYSTEVPEEPAGTCLTRIRLEEDGASFAHSAEPTDSGIVAAAVQVFQRASPEDVRVTMPVHL